MQVLRFKVPKAFLKSKLAMTCLGLAASLARMESVMAKPPWGGANSKLLAFQKGFKIRPGLGKKEMTDKFGPDHADENGSDPPTSFIKTNKFVVVG